MDRARPGRGGAERTGFVHGCALFPLPGQHKGAGKRDRPVDPWPDQDFRGRNHPPRGARFLLRRHEAPASGQRLRVGEVGAWIARIAPDRVGAMQRPVIIGARHLILRHHVFDQGTMARNEKHRQQQAETVQHHRAKVAMQPRPDQDPVPLSVMIDGPDMQAGPGRDRRGADRR
jgi:hypothetical protein